MKVLPSGLPEEVGIEESIIRFAFSRRKEMWLAEPPGRLKPAAFLPNGNRRPLETSVFRHSGQPQSELQAMASASFPGREPKGAGVVSVGLIRNAELDVIADESLPNPPRHANIIGWTEDSDPKMAKAAWKQQAMDFAGLSKIVWSA